MVGSVRGCYGILLSQVNFALFLALIFTGVVIQLNPIAGKELKHKKSSMKYVFTETSC